MRETPGTPVWQRNYFEHIIRNDNELNRIREYIATNPTKWETDRENPACALIRTGGCRGGFRTGGFQTRPPQRKATQ